MKNHKKTVSATQADDNQEVALRDGQSEGKSNEAALVSSTPRSAKFAVIICAIVIVVAMIAVFVIHLLTSTSTSTNQRLSVTTHASTPITTINMIGQWKGEDKRQNYILDTIKEFEIQNPTIRVNLKWNGDFPGGRGGALQAVSDQIKAGKTAWDIVWMEPLNYEPIANALNDQGWAQKYLVDFSTVPGFNESQKPFILSDPQYRNHFNGMMTGPYIEGFYQPLFYNKKVADKLGISIKTQNMTYDDFVGYLKDVYSYNQAHGTHYSAIYESKNEPTGSSDSTGGESTWVIFQSLFRSQIGDFATVKDLNPSAQKLAAVRTVLNSFQDLSQYHPLTPNHATNDWFATRGQVLQGNELFSAAGASWMYSHWRGIDSSKVMDMYPVDLPVYQPISFYIGGYNPMFAVMKNSPHETAAVKLMMAFSTPTSAEHWVSDAKAPSGVIGNVVQSGQGQQDQYDKYISDITSRYGANIYDSKTVDYVLGAKYANLTDLFCDQLMAVLDGKVTASAAYSTIVQAEQTDK